jgi:hypothetical protein
MRYYNLIIIALLMAGFTSCKEEAPAVPSSIKISQIIVHEYPVTSGAVPWDDPIIGSSTGPDVFWKITGPQSVESDVYFGDVNGEELVFDTGFPDYLNRPESTYYFELWDKDDIDGSDLGSTDDKIVSIGWKPYTGNGESGTEWVELVGPGVVADVKVTYLFE